MTSVARPGINQRPRPQPQQIPERTHKIPLRGQHNASRMAGTSVARNVSSPKYTAHARTNAAWLDRNRANASQHRICRSEYVIEQIKSFTTVHVRSACDASQRHRDDHHHRRRHRNIVDNKKTTRITPQQCA